MKFISLKKTPTLPYDKSQETDSQMLIRIGKKFFWLSIFLLMSDTLFDWFIGILDLLMDGLHLVIDTIEYSIELILESLFQADQQQSEMIIVNVALVIGLFLIYRFFLMIPKLLDKLINKISSYFYNKLDYWNDLPINRKIKSSCAYCFGITCILFLVTL